MLIDYDVQGWAPVPHAISRAPYLSLAAKVVYLVINSHIFAGKKCIEMTVAQIANEANCSYSHAKRALAELEGDWLYVERVNGAKSCYILSNIYRPEPSSDRARFNPQPSSHRPTPSSHRPTPELTQTYPLVHTEPGSTLNPSVVKRITNNKKNNNGPPSTGGMFSKNGVVASKYLPGGKYHPLFCESTRATGVCACERSDEV